MKSTRSRQPPKPQYHIGGNRKAPSGLLSRARHRLTRFRFRRLPCLTHPIVPLWSPSRYSARRDRTELKALDSRTVLRSLESLTFMVLACEN